MQRGIRPLDIYFHSTVHSMADIDTSAPRPRNDARRSTWVGEGETDIGEDAGKSTKGNTIM